MFKKRLLNAFDKTKTCRLVRQRVAGRFENVIAYLHTAQSTYKETNLKHLTPLVVERIKRNCQKF